MRCSMFSCCVRSIDLNSQRVMGYCAPFDPKVPSERGRESMVWRAAVVAMIFDIFDKAHVEHPVGFVENQHLKGREC